ncbi:methylmalonyl Co-A mutase-associated GTPase MeaB [Christiangramia sabulilitoris]|uniref:Methylmalonyl Co-A mutase-associated GTPase MeaB n=1 Tax=Christiangramia sabulilitoris TaxID=2583991 RepID=A0A550HZ13_9FLAO|nr:methylmalonyl Co-A mutase-associated GTPase MeaB [Christiangramia sabulilitoris]TRO63955.1 methylmalonyl Co-A mutase-associated GTPase MeaB [Christiangramia sabulilitoris]
MSKDQQKSALSESGNKPASGNVSPESAKKIRNFRKNKFSEQDLLKDLLNGNKTALSRGITLIESNQPAHRNQAEFLIEGALPYAHKSMRIGITGVPGVGKSTFIESFGSYLIEKGKKVAVLAVDPSSSVSHGSILGDKTRMENLVTKPNAFIRPSPSGDSLGGVARKTRESILLCEAAGFNVILIETVGVGQSETTVHSMTDFFLLLKLAGAGDELQGIKRGIVEMADAIVINKADGENRKAARDAKLEFRRALQLYPAKESEWKPEVKLCSAIYNEGVEDIWEMISDFKSKVDENGYFKHNRLEQNKFWLYQTVNDHLKSRFYEKPEIRAALKEQLELIENNKTTAFAAAKYLLSLA